jgi:transcriptional regulator with XRE-family HTH domain
MAQHFSGRSRASGYGLSPDGLSVLNFMRMAEVKIVQQDPSTTFSHFEQETAIQLAIQKMWAKVYEHVERVACEENKSIAEIGRRIGASRSQMHHWLSGPSNMTLRTAARLLLAAEADLDIGIMPWRDSMAEAEFKKNASLAAPIRLDLDPQFLNTTALSEVSASEFMRLIKSLIEHNELASHRSSKDDSCKYLLSPSHEQNLVSANSDVQNINEKATLNAEQFIA